MPREKKRGAGVSTTHTRVNATRHGKTVQRMIACGSVRTDAFQREAKRERNNNLHEEDLERERAAIDAG